MSDRIDLDQLERLESEATPAPWWNEIGVIHAPNGLGGACHPADTFNGNGKDFMADAELIAELRNAAPRLLAVVRAADKLADETALLPCLEKADINGKGVVPVPEWVVAEIAPVLAAYREARGAPA